MKQQEKSKRTLTQPPMQKGSPDDFQTPPEALLPLFPYLENNGFEIIWECAAGQGYLVKEFEARGYEVIATDIKTGHDFLNWNPKRFDCIITNPPYSIKQEFLERCYELGKPFALLLPLTTFETAKRQKLFKNHGIEIIFFDKRINFITPDEKSDKESSSWFSTAWFTWGFRLPQVLNYEKLQSKSLRNVKPLTKFSTQDLNK